jgi:beta-lactamase superfamily II metal-dependent hydrolase
MLHLRIVQAKFGDCLILIYGEKENPKYILIDGGPEGIFRDYLKTELANIKAANGSLEIVVLSHVDGDHIVGLLDFTEELRENAADELAPLIDVKELWINTFSQTIGRETTIKPMLQNMLTRVNGLASVMPHGNLALLSIAQGDALMRNALLLNIPVNKTFGGEIICNETVTNALQFENVRMTIIGPNQKNLDELKEEWLEWIKRNEAKILTSDREILAQMDRSVPNLSSIMFLVEADGKTILFTGDGRGDFILEGLERAGLLTEGGPFHVDVFKLPHHGSIRNTTPDFFGKVTADQYVISADGRHGNPDFETLHAIVTTAREQGRNIELILTNHTESTARLNAEFPEAEYGYKSTYMSDSGNSMMLLLSDL